MKKCRKCNTDKENTSFFKDDRSRDGLQSFCKKCKSTLISKYYKENPDKKSGKRTKEQNRQRYHNNKINYNISRRIRQSLNGLSKKETWSSCVGYSLNDLKNHLESKFDDKMNWENYGSYWHIDHIEPISYFNIISIDCEDFKECWGLKNLQPLEAKANLIKSNKIPHFD